MMKNQIPFATTSANIVHMLFIPAYDRLIISADIQYLTSKWFIGNMVN